MMCFKKCGRTGRTPLRISPDRLSDWLRERLLAAGACAVGVARAEGVSAETMRAYSDWLAQGCAGTLDYLQRHGELRADPRTLLPGCRSVVSTAWLYNPPRLRDERLPYIARYAYCRDYHKALRSVLKPIAREVEENYGAHVRICIDSAPIMERYWAVRSGVGFVGLNGLLIVPGVGSRVFLAELLIDRDLEPDEPCTLSCAGCSKCVKSCPAGALRGDGTLDCRRCISAQTIENPGGCLPPRPTLAGCDTCQDVCPHNAANMTTALEALAPLDRIVNFDARRLYTDSDEEIEKALAGTALKRIGAQGLRDNLAANNAYIDHL